MKYIIVTPAKNEAEYIRSTISSVINQTLLPEEWIIVDDGSDDDTFKIAKQQASLTPWMKVLNHETTGEQRSGGAKVVRAFNFGFSKISTQDFDFIVKLDADLELPSDYFESVANEFQNDPHLGLCGGIILNKYGDQLIQEGGLDYHIRGAFKSIRKETFEQIGGFKAIWYWDGIDEMEALFLGWKTKTIPKFVVHFRPTSNAYHSRKHAYKCGYEAYRMRNSLFLTIMRTIYRVTKKPIFINSVSYFCGYTISFLKRETFHIDKNLANFINSFHTNRILKKYLLRNDRNH